LEAPPGIEPGRAVFQYLPGRRAPSPTQISRVFALASYTLGPEMWSSGLEWVTPQLHTIHACFGEAALVDGSVD
jgi:hypothetical protein